MIVLRGRRRHELSRSAARLESVAACCFMCASFHTLRAPGRLSLSRVRCRRPQTRRPTPYHERSPGGGPRYLTCLLRAALHGARGGSGRLEAAEVVVDLPTGRGTVV